MLTGESNDTNVLTPALCKAVSCKTYTRVSICTAHTVRRLHTCTHTFACTHTPDRQKATAAMLTVGVSEQWGFTLIFLFLNSLRFLPSKEECVYNRNRRIMIKHHLSRTGAVESGHKEKISSDRVVSRKVSKRSLKT